jgi:hypothetical protein
LPPEAPEEELVPFILSEFILADVPGADGVDPVPALPAAGPVTCTLLPTKVRRLSFPPLRMYTVPV